MQMQTEAMELKPRMAMQQLPPSLLQERTVSMCQKAAVSLKLAAALKQTKASWAGEQTTADTSHGTKLFLRHLLAMVSWTQVVFAQGSCRVSPTCLLIGQEQSSGMWKHHLATGCTTAVLRTEAVCCLRCLSSQLFTGHALSLHVIASPLLTKCSQAAC